MTDTPAQELGPIDYMVVEFPAGEQRFSGAMATAELAALVEAGHIQILDLLVLVKDADGNVEAYEIEDLGDLGELKALEGDNWPSSSRSRTSSISPPRWSPTQPPACSSGRTPGRHRSRSRHVSPAAS